MKKSLFTFLGMLLFIQLSFAQGTFDSQVTSVSNQLAESLKKSTGKKVAVASFVDLQGNVTELGRYIAESFSIELSIAGLKVVDRSRFKDLLAELKLSEEKLLEPKNAAKLGSLAGIDIVVTGTTTLLDNSVELTIKALDLSRGVIIAAKRTSFARTEAINQLFRSAVGGGTSAAVPSAVANMPSATGGPNVNAYDDANKVKVTEMAKSTCIEAGYSYGYVCFENQLPEDLEIIYGPRGALSVLIPAGGKNCAPRVYVNSASAESTTFEGMFKFRTVNSDKVRYGSITIVVEACKNKTISLHSRNLLLSANRN